MQFKSDTFLVSQIFSMIKTQFYFDIKRICTDNGQKFLAHHLQKFFSNNEVIHGHTCAETPQQNGVSKQKYRHLLNIARCFRFQDFLPISF